MTIVSSNISFPLGNYERGWNFGQLISFMYYQVPWCIEEFIIENMSNSRTSYTDQLSKILRARTHGKYLTQLFKSWLLIPTLYRFERWGPIFIRPGSRRGKRKIRSGSSHVGISAYQLSSELQSQNYATTVLNLIYWPKRTSLTPTDYSVWLTLLLLAWSVTCKSLRNLTFFASATTVRVQEAKKWQKLCSRQYFSLRRARFSPLQSERNGQIMQNYSTGALNPAELMS